MDRVSARQHSSWGKQKLGRVSKHRGQISAAPADDRHDLVMRRLAGKTDGHSEWVKALLELRPFRLASLALANKMARIALAVMARQVDYQKPVAAAMAG